MNRRESLKSLCAVLFVPSLSDLPKPDPAVGIEFLIVGDTGNVNHRCVPVHKCVDQRSITWRADRIPVRKDIRNAMLIVRIDGVEVARSESFRAKAGDAIDPSYTLNLG